MSADEVRRYDAFMADSDAIKAMIDRENAANALDAAARDNVPTAIRDNGAASSEDSAPVLTKEQRCVDATGSTAILPSSEQRTVGS